MHLKPRSKSLPLALALAATTAFGFTGGAVWSQSAGVAAAADDVAAQADHGYLGMSIAQLNDQLAARLNLPAGATGIVVMRVDASGPAATAGMKAGDIVTTINSTAVTSLKSAHDALASVKPNDVVQVGITRSGAAQTIAVTAGAMPARQPRAGGGQPGQGGQQPGQGNRPGQGGERRGGPSMGPGMGANDPLKDIPADQRFDHMRGGSMSFTDKDGNLVTLRTIPGRVVSATDASVVVTPNGASSPSAYTITSTTHLRGKGSDLKADEKVMVEIKDGSSDALAIMPAERPARPQAPANSQNGQNGQNQRGHGSQRGQSGQSDANGQGRTNGFSGGGSAGFGFRPAA